MHLRSLERGPDQYSGVMLYDFGLFDEAVDCDRILCRDGLHHYYVRVFATPDVSDTSAPLRLYAKRAYRMGYGLEIIAEDGRLILSSGELWSYFVQGTRCGIGRLGGSSAQARRPLSALPPQAFPLYAQCLLSGVLQTLGYAPELGVYDHGPGSRLCLVLPIFDDAAEHLEYLRWYFPPSTAVQLGAEYEGPWLPLDRVPVLR